MSTIDKMLSDLKDIAELKKFAEAQNKTILNLSKELKESKEKLKHLEKLLESTTEIIPSSSEYSKEDEAICIRQLQMLRDLSNDRELTYEEAKKVDTYSKILQNVRGQKLPIEDKTKQLDTAELLQLVKNEK